MVLLQIALIEIENSSVFGMFIMVLIISRVKAERPLMMKWQLGKQKAIRNIVIEVVQILRILMNKKNQVNISLQYLKVAQGFPQSLFIQTFFVVLKIHL